MYNSNNIAGRIKEIAKFRAVSLKETLDGVGLGFNTMSNMKKSVPKADNLAKIADYLDCSVDYLLGRTENVQAHKGVAEANNELLEIFEELNDEGKTALMAMARGFSAESKYKKCLEISEGVS